MDEAIRVHPRDVRDALHRLGLTLAILQDAVRAGIVARISRTENDPLSAPGFYQWAETVRMLRENLVVHGWTRRNPSGLPTVVSPSGKIAISASSGNLFTGLTDRSPSTKYLKGPGTIHRVESNAELLLPFPDWNAAVRGNAGSSAIATWTLLFYAEKDEVRSELSLPVKIDSNGQITGWRERIVLPTLPFDGNGGGQILEPDFGPDIDIDVRRRA